MFTSFRVKPRTVRVLFQQTMALFDGHIFLINMHRSFCGTFNDGHLNAFAAVQLVVHNRQVDNFVAIVVQVHHLIGVGNVKMYKVVEVIINVQYERVRVIGAYVD